VLLLVLLRLKQAILTARRNVLRNQLPTDTLTTIGERPYGCIYRNDGLTPRFSTTCLQDSSRNHRGVTKAREKQNGEDIDVTKGLESGDLPRYFLVAVFIE